ncbi:NAD-dependent epimerase/dehydratase family protein [Paraliomyxa miuraensis]|uniref:NAD-dependent epimerase/dehydratase family protein n=1 Tax=Paraliomyxa miuraensis TaxID=376150 RepID=UPI002255D62C|nr:NAD-dependent epimerase/dehydratase family protein [Paraliomyxa miuraensis]MCX4246137.1 NAD-dependent epimerase/dehydratase family protein [Paraliomyxa miuraensis]
MRVLVTGAGGQVGLDLIAELCAGGHEAHGSDVVARPGAGVLDPAVPWHGLDVTDPERVDGLVGEIRPDRIYHLAAILSARGEINPQRTYLVNQQGTWNVLEACRTHGVEQLIFTSTIAAYGPGLPPTVPEDVPLHPTTMYGVTKVAGELLGEYYHHRYGLDFRGVRFPGLISASLPGGGTSDYALFMYVDGVRHGAYQAFCRADTRIPLMYMPDGIRALVELPEAPRSRLRRCIYNVAAFSPSAQQIADSVARAIPGVRIGFEPDPRRQAILDSWPDALDDAAARADWGWQCRFDLDAMTDDLVPRVRELLERDPDQLGNAPH